MNQATLHRRTLHEIPELSYQEFKTKEYIISVLKQCNCEIIEMNKTGVLAYFDNGKEKTIAYRADMDALPIKEETGLDFTSKHAGIMHACGHDGHMAILLGFAEEISQIKKADFKYNVLLVFQPSEETIGGAKPICESGIFKEKNTFAILGTHVYPFLEKGAIGSRPNEFMSRCSEVDIEIIGKSVHAAESSNGIDPIEVGAELLTRLYAMERNELKPEDYRILKFGHFTGGTVRNIIPEKAYLGGSYRSFSDDVFNLMVDRTLEIASDLEKEYGCTINFNKTEGYPALINHEGLFNEVKKTLLKDFKFVQYNDPFMIAEDFSFYCKETAGCFIYLGTGTGIALHNCHFDFDEEILQTGIKAYLKLLEINEEF